MFTNGFQMWDRLMFDFILTGSLNNIRVGNQPKIVFEKTHVQCAKQSHMCRFRIN